MLHKEIPFLRIVLPLCAGIVSGLYIHPGIYICIILIIICLAGFVFSLFFNSQLTNHVYGPALFISLFTSGLFLFTRERQEMTELKPEKTVFISTLEDFPEEKQNTYMLSVKLSSSVSGNTINMVKGSMLIYYEKDSLISPLLPGDIIKFRCTPAEITNKGNPYEFNYKFYMESKGVRYYALTGRKDMISVHSPPHRKFKYKALIIRERIINMYEKRGIKGERLALVAAITLGEKSHLDPEQKQNFINAGVMHIMAVSGLHAVILSLFIFNLLFFLKQRFNILRITLTLTILWAFAFVTGLTPSVLRATLMFSFLQAGSLMKRRVNPVNSVLASAFVLILLRSSVIFDAGFLLSYAAVFYIIIFYQDLYLKVRFRRWFTDTVWRSVAITLIAQSGTLPLTIMLFNRFPTYFILTNVVIVPLSSFLIIIGCLVPLTFPIVPVSQFLASILDSLTGLTELLTEKAASLPYSTIDRIGMTSVECIVLMVTLSLLLFFLLKRQSVNIIYPVAAFLLFTVTITIKSTSTRRSNELIIYNTTGYSTIGIRAGNLLNLYSEKISLPSEVIRHVATLGLKVKSFRIDDKPLFLKAGNINLLITDTLKSIWLSGDAVDILILTGRRPFIDYQTASQKTIGPVIILTEAPASFHFRFPSAASFNKTIWSVRKSGGYRQPL